MFFKDTSAARHDPLEGLRAMGIILGPHCGLAGQAPTGPGRSSSPWGKDGDSDGDSSSSADEQEGMAAMCAALQDTVPQLTEAVEAALRRGVGREAYGHLAAVGTSFLRNLTRNPVFVAAGLAVPSSSVLRPLSSLSFTLLKLVNAIHTEPDADHRELSIASGVSCFKQLAPAPAGQSRRLSCRPTPSSCMLLAPAAAPMAAAALAAGAAAAAAAQLRLSSRCWSPAGAVGRAV